MLVLVCCCLASGVRAQGNENSVTEKKPRNKIPESIQKHAQEDLRRLGIEPADSGQNDEGAQSLVEGASKVKWNNRSC